MVSENAIEQKIEQLRLKMYQAYNSGESQSSVLRISKELDTLLNQLDEHKK